MGCLRLVYSLKLQVSFAKEPYKRGDILQKRRIMWRSLLLVATAYLVSCYTTSWPSSPGLFTCATILLLKIEIFSTLDQKNKNAAESQIEPSTTWNKQTKGLPGWMHVNPAYLGNPLSVFNKHSAFKKTQIRPPQNLEAWKLSRIQFKWCLCSDFSQNRTFVTVLAMRVKFQLVYPDVFARSKAISYYILW